MTAKDGIFVDGAPTVRGDTTGPNGVRILFQDPDTEVGVLEIARDGIAEFGLGFDHCTVAAVLNEDAMADQELAKVNRLVVEVARTAVILNADDPICFAMRDHTEAKAVYLVTMDLENAAVGSHVEAGGPAVVLTQEDGADAIAIFYGGIQTTVMAANQIPTTGNQGARHHLQYALFATALAHALGVGIDTTRAGLSEFKELNC